MEASKALMPVVVQHAHTGAVLMVAFADAQALERTRTTGWAHFFSRSRGRLWMKGETSGHRLRVVQMRPDCDGDAWVYEAIPEGPVCHTGQATCFDAVSSRVAILWLMRLEEIVTTRRHSAPTQSYTASLWQAGLERIVQKVGEEAVEVLVAAFQESTDRLTEEVADLIYHLTVLLVMRGGSWVDVLNTLRDRHAEDEATSDCS